MVELQLLCPQDRVEMQAGDALIIETPGGGGWGSTDY